MRRTAIMMTLVAFASAAAAQTATLLGDLNPATTAVSSNPIAAHEVDGGWLFFARNAQQRLVLWRTDGTTAGTSLLVTLADVDGPYSLQSTPSRLYFRALDSAGQSALWISDGTVAGTRPVVAMSLGINTTAALGDQLIFTGYDSNGNNSQPWISDGTAAGTRPIIPDGGGVNPRAYTTVGSRVAFTANWDQGVELWSTDGTAAGTAVIQDLTPDAGQSTNPDQLVSVAGRLYFVARGATPQALYQWDGVSSAVTAVMTPPPPNY